MLLDIEPGVVAAIQIAPRQRHFTDSRNTLQKKCSNAMATKILIYMCLIIQYFLMKSTIPTPKWRVSCVGWRERYLERETSDIGRSAAGRQYMPRAQNITCTKYYTGYCLEYYLHRVSSAHDIICTEYHLQSISSAQNIICREYFLQRISSAQNITFAEYYK